MSKVRKKFDQTLYFFQQMELNSFEREIYETQFEAFVSAARSVTFAMQKENKIFYDENIQNKIKDDLLMKFFNGIRTFSIHEGDSKIDSKNEGLHMRHRLSFDGKGGCIAFIRSRNGDIIKEINIKSDPNAEIFLGGIGINFNSGLWEKTYYFDSLEDFDLPNRTIISVTDFCYQYLEKLFDLINIYINKTKIN